MTDLEEVPSPPSTSERLRTDYPELFSACWDISIGPGWYPLVDTLCACLQRERKVLEDNLASAEAASANLEYWTAPRVASLRQLLAEITNNPLMVGQVKEKFGGLRFYVDGGLSPEHQCMVALAEALSYRICETCGALGEPRTNIGRIRTLCDVCHRDRV